MADTGPAVWEIVGVAAILFVILLVGYYAITRLKTRRKQLSLELDTSRELVEDRAFNQLRLARTEADLLDRQGTDVSRIRPLIAEAEAARDRRDFDNALALARSAHESLVKLQGGHPLPGGSVSSGPLERSAPSPAADPPGLRPAGAGLSTEGLMGRTSPTGLGEAALPEAPPKTALPRNKAEARFQLSLLADELTRATESKGPNAQVLEATEIRDTASAAFDRGEFTEAMRLALRGRRRLGTQLETLPPKPGTKTPPSPVPDEAVKCSSCGEPLRGNDRFCRFCGTLRGPARCAGCGAPLENDDRFCATCGRPVGDLIPS